MTKKQKKTPKAKKLQVTAAKNFCKKCGSRNLPNGKCPKCNPVESVGIKEYDPENAG